MTSSKTFVIPLLIAMHGFFDNIAIAAELPGLYVDSAVRDSTALTAAGPSGGLTIPSGRALEDGTAVIGFNNYLEPRFSNANRGANYLFSMGILPYVEISGRLTNYPNNQAPFFFVRRDLSANAKVTLPKFFNAQPDIAFGANDLAGGAPNFRTHYVAVSQRFGPLSVTVGAAKGVRELNGFFGGAELALGGSGFSILAERNSGVEEGGVRYTSAPIASLGNAHLVATAQRSFGARTPEGASFNKSTVAVNLVIPFGDNARSSAGGTQRSTSTLPDNALVAETAAQSVPAQSGLARNSADSIQAALHPTTLQPLQAALVKVGLERVRVGMAGSALVVEYENHRYNRNEVDALGIVFGMAARLAPDAVSRIRVVTRKSGLALMETSVDRAGFEHYLRDMTASPSLVAATRTLHPAEESGVEWLDREQGPRGFSRVVVKPVLSSFIGTEIGLYDYSLGASVQGFVPVWKGAELSADYVANLADSNNVRNGSFAFGRQRSGLRSALISQAFWVTDYLFNVTSAGKLQYDFAGVQNETTLFVPGRDDQVRVEFTRMKFSDAFVKEIRQNTGAFYRWTYQPLNLWVEAGYNKYVGNDRGPSVRLSRWFGDVEAQAFIRRSNQITIAGFQLVFPLTPREGMRPGITDLEGTSRFGYGLETKLARQGGDNRITRNVAETIPMAYSAQTLLLNRGRVGLDYVASQLPRMREAALLFMPFD